MRWHAELKVDAVRRAAEIDIYDVVGDPWMGTSAFAILYQLRSMDVDDLLVRINSVGGSVSEGMDIHNLIKEHPASRKVARVSGVAASIATVIALACQAVEMHANSQWMVHESKAAFDFGAPPMAAADLLRMADLLDKTNRQMLEIYAFKTGKDPEELAKFCAAETWFTADEAKEFGFCDRVIGVADTASMLVAAAAWEPNLIAKLKSFPAPLRAVARTAQAPQPKEPPVRDPEPPTAVSSEEEFVMKLKSTDFLKKTAELAKIFADIHASADKAALEAKSKDLSKLEEDLKEMSKRAKTAEEELGKMSESAAEYEDAKKRAEDAESQLEDLKKKLAEMDDEEDDDYDDGEEESSTDDDEKKKAKAELKTATKAELRRIVYLNMKLTGCYSMKKIEGAVLAVGHVAVVSRINDERKARIEKLKLAPAVAKSAMRMSASAFDEFERRMAKGGRGPTEQHDPNPQASRQVQNVTDPDDVTLTADEIKVARQAMIPLDRALQAKKESMLARGQLRPSN